MTDRPFDQTLFAEALDRVPPPHQEEILDSLFCALHNKGYELQGNTEATDLEWFSRALWERATLKPGWQWEQVLSEEEREEWRETARAALEVLPLLMSRISHRCIRMSEVVQGMLRVERGA